MRSASGGLGLGGLVIVIGGLYYTGMGEVLLQRMQSFDQGCRGMLAVAGNRISNPVCSGVNAAVGGITNLSDTIGQSLHGIEAHIRGTVSSGMHFAGVDSLGGSFRNSVSGLTSSSDQLGRMILAGPGHGQAGSTAQQFQQAVDSFSIGQHYLAENNNVSQALPWLARGAQQPQGYGLLSQLSLGDIYSKGTGGVAANPVQSIAYYEQASSSLSQLSQSNTPQSKQMLQALPVSPQVLQQQLLQTIAQLKAQAKR